jgi:hypothetical protein
MTTPDDRDAPYGEPQPQAWDAPPQAPAWDRPPDTVPAWGPPPGYAPAAHPGAQGYGAPSTIEGKAVAALVLAIVSWVALPFVAAVVSLVLAGSAKRDIGRSQGRLGGAGLVTASRIISWANIALCLAIAAAFVLFVAVFATAGFS